MRRVVIGLAMVTTALTTVGSVSAGEFGLFRFWTDIERNKMWPEPFIHEDRAVQRQPWAVMIDRGWQLQNTLGDFHFDRETHQLTTAGQHKVRWIVTQAPIHRRTVFVQRAATADITATRLDAVQRSVAGTLTQGPLPEVVQSDLAPPGAPADIIDRIYRGRDASQPAPVLPTASGGSGGSGGSN